MSTGSNTPDIIHRTTCRICESTDLEPILSLGPIALANSYLKSPAEFASESLYPLDLYFCRRCTLLQLLDTASPEVLFRHYVYVSGMSTTMAEHNRQYVRTLVDLLGLKAQDLVVEVASNDGTFLRCFAGYDVRTLGVDPARNLAAEATAAGIETIPEFFTVGLAESLRAERGPARAIVANNVLGHAQEPREFLAACRTLLADDGLVTVEVPYAGEMIERVEYDTIYHEHVSYFTIGALLRACEFAGLRMVRIDRVPVHGGSIRLYMSRAGGDHAPEVKAQEDAERRAGLAGVARYQQFARDAHARRDELVGMLESLVASGKRVAGYGAAAKGNILLNFCRIDTRLVSFIVDRNPRKIGLYSPGMHIPVHDVSALHTAQPLPDYILILPWNLAEEIMVQQQGHRDRGGRFIIPVPRPQVV